MALFSFGKKTAPPPIPPSPGMPFAAPPQGLPVDQVNSLVQQGYSDAQIIGILGQQGYSPQQISDAIAQVTQAGAEPYQSAPQESEPQPSHPAEEVVEAIVEEKWHELDQKLAKHQEWRERTDSRVDRLEQAFNELRKQIETLNTAIIAKIGDYDKSLLEVGTEMKAMEKVFQKVLPELTSSVQEISKVSKRLQGDKR